MPLTMAEPGWPLIPREVLPAPVEPARVRSRRAATAAAAPPGKQLSVFGVEAVDPSLADLAGLLAGPGTLGRMGGTARVAVRVDAAWRVHVLVEELVSRGLVVNWHPVAAEPREERVAELVAVPVDQEIEETGAAEETAGTEAEGAAAESAAAERAGAGRARADRAEADRARADRAGADRARAGGTGADRVGAGRVEAGGADAADGGAPPTPEPTPADEKPEHGEAQEPSPAFEVRTAYSSRLNGLARSWPPSSGRLFLNGPRLRLWVAAAGSPRPQGFALGLNPDGLLDNAIDDALSRVGLAGTIQAGPAYVIAGRRRLTRLAELIGERPAAAPARLWPGAAAA